MNSGKSGLSRHLCNIQVTFQKHLPRTVDPDIRHIPVQRNTQVRLKNTGQIVRCHTDHCRNAVIVHIHARFTALYIIDCLFNMDPCLCLDRVSADAALPVNLIAPCIDQKRRTFRAKDDILSRAIQMKLPHHIAGPDGSSRSPESLIRRPADAADPLSAES